MSLRDELLSPIPGAKPGGSDLRYDPVFDKIKEARREDDDAPQGDWQTTRKTADWPLVIKLSKDVLAKKSKDLQIAAWLSEALLHREGFAGLRDGIDLVTGLLDSFWDDLYPEIDEGDLEMRVAPLEWIGLKLDQPVRLAPIDRAGHDMLRYKESRSVPTDTEAQSDSAKLAARNAAVEARKLLPEEFDAAFDATPKAWYKSLVADLQGLLGALEALDEAARSKFADVAPNLSRLRDALDEVLRTAQQLLKRKLELDPDPVEEAPAAAPGAAVSAEIVAGAAGPRALAAEPTSRDDAASRIVGAARWLRQNDPLSPAAYLLLRGFRWGELRAGGDTVDPRLLDAPTTQTRTHLKGLLLDHKWKELLEASESTMGTPQGRGWLDLQRYALTACDQLGSEYHFISDAIRAELRTLLADLPALLDMTLMDDTPTANAETRTWLRDSVYNGAAAPVGMPAGSDAPADEPRLGDPRAAAQTEVRAGRTDRAIALLMRESAREKTKRGRFLYQTDLAGIMVESGHVSVAMPILQELLSYIETHHLEEWESGELVAKPMILMYRALEQTGGDASTRESLYLQICRLDPVQAMRFAQQPAQ